MLVLGCINAEFCRRIRVGRRILLEKVIEKKVNVEEIISEMK